MSELIHEPNICVAKLSRSIATKYVNELADLANQIPGVDYGPENILAEQKGDRKFHNKWDHSIVMFDGNNPVGLLIAYERESEGNDQYPCNTLYISELAVSESHQKKGLSRSLIDQFLSNSKNSGFYSLDGDLNFSIQTNSAEWNRHVVALYESFGFQKRALKLILIALTLY